MRAVVVVVVAPSVDQMAGMAQGWEQVLVEAFIRAFLEDDILAFGLRIPAETLCRFRTMLAQSPGGSLDTAKLAASLARSQGISISSGI